MTEIKFHSNLKEQEDEAELTEQLERLLGFFRKHRRPIMRPNRTERGWPKQNSRRDFADSQRLVKESPAEAANSPSGVNDNDPLQQQELEMAFGVDRGHNGRADDSQSDKTDKVIIN